MTDPVASIDRCTAIECRKHPRHGDHKERSAMKSSCYITTDSADHYISPPGCSTVTCQDLQVSQSSRPLDDAISAQGWVTISYRCANFKQCYLCDVCRPPAEYAI